MSTCCLETPELKAKSCFHGRAREGAVEPTWSLPTAAWTPTLSTFHISRVTIVTTGLLSPSNSGPQREKQSSGEWLTFEARELRFPFWPCDVIAVRSLPL